MLNNPIRYLDPTGHMVPCEDGDVCDHDYPAPIPGKGNGGGGGNNGGGPGGGHDDDDDLDPNPNNLPPILDELDFYWSLGNETCDIDCQGTLQGLFVFGWMMDSLALGLNTAYALVADIGLLINPVIYAGMVVEFQWFSKITNIIGSAGGIAWIASGFLSGDNRIEIAANNGFVNISGSIAQDTIATVLVDGAGWVAPWAQEPNGAVATGGVGVIYDVLRNPFDPILPTFFQPTFSFTINTNNLWH